MRKHKIWLKILRKCCYYKLLILYVHTNISNTKQFFHGYRDLLGSIIVSGNTQIFITDFKLKFNFMSTISNNLSILNQSYISISNYTDHRLIFLSSINRFARFSTWRNNSKSGIEVKTLFHVIRSDIIQYFSNWGQRS